MDRHDIWRRAQHDWQQANARRAQGHVPVVFAWVAGRPEPIELGWVTTRRAPDEVWIRFETPGPKVVPETGAIPPAVSWIYVHENALLSVEVAYRRDDRPGIGFVWSMDDEEELAA